MRRPVKSLLLLGTLASLSAFASALTPQPHPLTLSKVANLKAELAPKPAPFSVIVFSNNQKPPAPRMRMARGDALKLLIDELTTQ